MSKYERRRREPGLVGKRNFVEPLEFLARKSQGVKL